MSEASVNEVLPFEAFFTSAKVGASGLAVTVDIYDESGTPVVTGASATEIGSTGVYRYQTSVGLADSQGLWTAMFKTASTSVDQQWIPAAITVRGNNTNPAGALPISSAVSLTWSDILDYVNSFYRFETALPNDKLFRMLASQALKDVSERALLYQKTWTNELTGDLTIADNVVTMPLDCIKVDRVEWNSSDNPLSLFSIREFDLYISGWRTQTGAPSDYAMSDSHTMVLSTSPGLATGSLTVRGRGYLPEFSEEPGDQNPLVFIPYGSQLMVAYYIIAELPLIPATPINDSNTAISAARDETNRRQNARLEYKEKYTEAVEKLKISTDRKQNIGFEF